ncbi:IS1 family transposase, partial [Trichodesmium erythraeum 21-75]|nr:IS1 family transposase [Trichodesmium erythraeum 21-75]
RRTIQPEQVPMEIPAHFEGSSLRGISRTLNWADNTVVSLVRATCEKGHMIHNVHLQNINTLQISSDEFWSLVQKNKNSASIRN